MNLTKYFESNKLDMDQVLVKYLNINNKNSINKDTAIGKKLFYQEVSSEEILKSYNRSGNNFQKELMTQIKPSVMENIQKSLKQKELEKNKNQLINANKDKVDEATKSLNSKGIEVSKEQEEKISKKSEKEKSELTEDEIENQIIIDIYEAVLDERQKLRSESLFGPNGQVKTGELYDGDKIGIKLVLCEDSLRKIDTYYKINSKTNSYIAQDDDKIAEKRNKYLNEEIKARNTLTYKTKDNLLEIASLNDRIENISKQIVELTEKSKSTSDNYGFDDKMDKLQKEYLDASIKLTSINPNSLELNEQIEKQEEMEEYRTRKIGTVYKKENLKNSSGMYSKDRESNEFKKSIQDKVNTEVLDSKHASLDAAENLIEAANNMVKDPDKVEKVEEIIQSAESFVNVGAKIDSKDKKANIKEQRSIQNNEEDPNIENNRSKTKISKRSESLQVDLKNVEPREKVLNTDLEQMKINKIRLTNLEKAINSEKASKSR